MEGRVLLALVISAAALSVIFILDTIEDKVNDCVKDGSAIARITKIIFNIVSSQSILIGFTWEQCFEHGLEGVAEVSGRPVSTKFVFTIVVTVLIVPAWRRYILHKVITLEKFKDERRKAKVAT